jgi:hypothetical protein
MQSVFLEHKVSILSVTAIHWQILRQACARCVLKQKSDSDNEPTHGRGVLVRYARRKTDSGWVAFSQVPEVEGRGDSWSKFGLNEGGVLACPSNYDRQIYTVHDKVSIG